MTCQLCDRLKMEAQSHAMEARGANDTIQKIYQIVTGARGEPGNWNAEVPVREEIERLRASNAELADVLKHLLSTVEFYRKIAPSLSIDLNNIDRARAALLPYVKREMGR